MFDVASCQLNKCLKLRYCTVSASIQGVEAALSRAMTLAITRIEIDNAESSVEYLDQTISLTAGMPYASAGSLRALLEIDVPASWTRNWETVACDESEFCILGNMFVGKSGYVTVPNFPLSSNGDLDRVSYIWPNGYTLNSNGCYAFYINEASEKITTLVQLPMAVSCLAILLYQLQLIADLFHGLKQLTSTF